MESVPRIDDIAALAESLQTAARHLSSDAQELSGCLRGYSLYKSSVHSFTAAADELDEMIKVRERAALLSEVAAMSDATVANARKLRGDIAQSAPHSAPSHKGRVTQSDLYGARVLASDVPHQPSAPTKSDPDAQVAALLAARTDREHVESAISALHGSAIMTTVSTARALCAARGVLAAASRSLIVTAREAVGAAPSAASCDPLPPTGEWVAHAPTVPHTTPPLPAQGIASDALIVGPDADGSATCCAHCVPSGSPAFAGRGAFGLASPDGAASAACRGARTFEPPLGRHCIGCVLRATIRTSLARRQLVAAVHQAAADGGASARTRASRLRRDAYDTGAGHRLDDDSRYRDEFDESSDADGSSGAAGVPSPPPAPGCEWERDDGAMVVDVLAAAGVPQRPHRPRVLGAQHVAAVYAAPPAGGRGRGGGPQPRAPVRTGAAVGAASAARGAAGGAAGAPVRPPAAPTLPPSRAAPRDAHRRAATGGDDESTDDDDDEVSYMLPPPLASPSATPPGYAAPPPSPPLHVSVVAHVDAIAHAVDAAGGDATSLRLRLGTASVAYAVAAARGERARPSRATRGINVPRGPPGVGGAVRDDVSVHTVNTSISRGTAGAFAGGGAAASTVAAAEARARARAAKSRVRGAAVDGMRMICAFLSSHGVFAPTGWACGCEACCASHARVDSSGPFAFVGGGSGHPHGGGCLPPSFAVLSSEMRRGAAASVAAVAAAAMAGQRSGAVIGLTGSLVGHHRALRPALAVGGGPFGAAATLAVPPLWGLSAVWVPHREEIVRWQMAVVRAVAAEGTAAGVGASGGGRASPSQKCRSEDKGADDDSVRAIAAALGRVNVALVEHSLVSAADTIIGALRHAVATGGGDGPSTPIEEDYAQLSVRPAITEDVDDVYAAGAVWTALQALSVARGQSDLIAITRI